MDFGNQIKKIREEKKLTQEQMAQSLNVTRQAVSNWENNRNLPDIEMLIAIAGVYHVSLDQLILGDDNMNNMTEKLIKDGSETRKARMNMISLSIGIACFLLGITCLIIRAVTGDSIGDDGMLQEYFFLVPVAFCFFLCGFLTFLITGIRNIISFLTDKNSTGSENRIALIIISAVVCLICIGGFFALKIANSGEPDSFDVRNPSVGYDTLKEAEMATGYTFLSLDVDGFVPGSYLVIAGDEERQPVLEVSGKYRNMAVTLRMGKGEQRVSGIYGGKKISNPPADTGVDYMEYRNTKYVEWDKDGFCYAIMMENGTVDDLKVFIDAR